MYRYPAISHSLFSFLHYTSYLLCVITTVMSTNALTLLYFSIILKSLLLRFCGLESKVLSGMHCHGMEDRDLGPKFLDTVGAVLASPNLGCNG